MIHQKSIIIANLVDISVWLIIITHKSKDQIYWYIKGSYDIITTLEIPGKRQSSPWNGRFTYHLDIVEPNMYINIVEKYRVHRTLHKLYKTSVWPQELISKAFQYGSAADTWNNYNDMNKNPI